MPERTRTRPPAGALHHSEWISCSSPLSRPLLLASTTALLLPVLLIIHGAASYYRAQVFAPLPAQFRTHARSRARSTLCV